MAIQELFQFAIVLVYSTTDVMTTVRTTLMPHTLGQSVHLSAGPSHTMFGIPIRIRAMLP